RREVREVATFTTIHADEPRHKKGEAFVLCCGAFQTESRASWKAPSAGDGASGRRSTLKSYREWHGLALFGTKVRKRGRPTNRRFPVRVGSRPRWMAGGWWGRQARSAVRQRSRRRACRQSRPV